MTTERHFTIAELAELWHLSEKIVREMFEDAKGVLRVERPRVRAKRAYVTVRVPESVANSVYVAYTAGGKK